MRKKFVFLCLIISFFTASAQYGAFYHEVGITAGPVFFHSDYGERGDFQNFIDNNGFAIGAHYYFTPNEDLKSMREYFKIRGDFNYMKANLQHYGKYVDSRKTSLVANQLRAMRAKIDEVSVGGQIEYFPFKTDDYVIGIGFSPYIAMGTHANFYSVSSTTNLGVSNIPSTTPVKYLNAVESASKVVMSINGAIGTRYKLSDYHSILAEFSTKYYFSDYVDGLNPDRVKYTENKANDWMTTINFGYIYYFN